MTMPSTSSPRNLWRTATAIVFKACRRAYETKYPPLLVWILALAWKIDPPIPAKLTVVTTIQWAAIPLFLWLSLLWFPARRTVARRALAGQRLGSP